MLRTLQVENGENVAGGVHPTGEQGERPSGSADALAEGVSGTSGTTSVKRIPSGEVQGAKCPASQASSTEELKQFEEKQKQEWKQFVETQKRKAMAADRKAREGAGLSKLTNN